MKILNANQCICESVDVEAICGGKLNNYDLFVVPGGTSNDMADKISSNGREVVRDFVRSGGGYIGICAGAYLASSTFERFLGLVNRLVRKLSFELEIEHGTDKIHS